MDTEKIDLPDGQWWEIKTTITRGMRKEFRKASLSGLSSGMNGQKIDLSNPEELKAYVMSHPDKWNLDAIDDCYLLHGTVAFSFGDKITREAIDQIEDKITSKVLARMKELYQEMPEEVRKDFFAQPSPQPRETGS